MRDASIIEELHSNFVAGSDLSDLSFGSIGERAQVAAEIAIVRGKIVEGVGELGRHVVLASGGLTNILPVARYLTIEDKLAENIVSRGGLRQRSANGKDDGRLHLGRRKDVKD